MGWLLRCDYEYRRSLLIGYLKDESNECGGLQRERERERRACVCVCVYVCEKVTVEIQIHKHSAIVSQWDFFARFFVHCANIVGPIA